VATIGIMVALNHVFMKVLNLRRIYAVTMLSMNPECVCSFEPLKEVMPTQAARLNSLILGKLLAVTSDESPFETNC